MSFDNFRTTQDPLENAKLSFAPGDQFTTTVAPGKRQDSPIQPDGSIRCSNPFEPRMAETTLGSPSSSSSQKDASAARTPGAQTENIYSVKNGDTLWSIARQELRRTGLPNPTEHETKLELQRIISANADQAPHLGSHSSRILPGLQLKLPDHELVLEPLNYGKAANRHFGNAGSPSAKDGQAMAAPTPNSAERVDPDSIQAKKAARGSLGGRHNNHHHHYLRDLHNLEKKVVSFTRTAIDNLHHWLDATAAKAFLLAKREAEAHGVHIQITSAGRTFADQSRLYRQLHGHSAVALPGTSNHESGRAIDIQNWRQAKPYLLAHGFVHGDGHGQLKNDPWHFKYIG